MRIYLHKNERWPDYELMRDPPTPGTEQWYLAVEVTEEFYRRWQRLSEEYDTLMADIADIEAMTQPRGGRG